MEGEILMGKPEHILLTARDALTTVTPNNERQDQGSVDQLSDSIDVFPAAPVQAIAEEAMHTPFSDAPIPEGGGQSDVVSSDDTPREPLLDFVGAASDASRQHRLLRHSLPSEQRGNTVLNHFGVETVSDAAKIIKKMSQRDLQAKFKAVYGTRTFSNNNNWLRRKLFEAIGLDPSKGAVKKPGAGTQRRRRPSKPSNPRASVPRIPRRSRADAEADHHSVAEALLALGEIAGLAAEGYNLDELEERLSADIEDDGSDGQVPSACNEDDARDREGRISWSSQEHDALRASRGVPRAESAPATTLDDIKAEMDDGVAVPQEMAYTMGHVFEWMAYMQRHAMEAAGPHNTAALAAMMNGHPHHLTHAPPAVQIQMAMQMAAMGNPHAAGLLHTLMASGAMSHQVASADGYQRMVEELAAGHQQHPMAVMQKLVHGGP